MPQIVERMNCFHDINEAFSIIEDVRAYKEFVPACYESVILLQEKGLGSSYVHHARLSFRKWGKTMRLLTCNTYSPHRLIKMEMISGDLEYLVGKVVAS